MAPFRQRAVIERLLVVFEAEFKLLEGSVDGLDGFDAVAAEVVGGVFQMFFGVPERGHGCADFRMGSGSREQ